MTKSKFVAAIGAAVLVTLPITGLSAGEPVKGQKVDKNHESANDPATVVCKRLPPPAGSRISGKKVCKTNAAWNAEREAAGVAARERQDRSAVATRGN